MDRELTAAFGYTFRDCKLLALALAHSSWANETGLNGQHNERLEFLGDAVLELCVSNELYNRFPHSREGSLTRMRSNLVNEHTLAAIAVAQGIDRNLKLGVGEEKQGGRSRPAVLADALEAVLGAIYRDGGYLEAQTAVARIFAGRWPSEVEQQQSRDYKSLIQQACQNIFHQMPDYTLLGTDGPEHAKIFEVCLTLPDGHKFTASNTSRKRAEQDAAGHALKHLMQAYGSACPGREQGTD